MTVATMDRPVETMASRTARLAAWHADETSLTYLQQTLTKIHGAFTDHAQSRASYTIELPVGMWRMFEGPIRDIAELLNLDLDLRDTSSTDTVSLTIAKSTEGQP